MVKTTVYLPDDLKQKVEQLAERRGVSEADVIRAAITHEIVADQPVGTGAGRFPVFHSGNHEPFAERDEELLGEIGFGER